MEKQVIATLTDSRMFIFAEEESSDEGEPSAGDTNKHTRAAAGRRDIAEKKGETRRRRASMKSDCPGESSDGFHSHLAILGTVGLAHMNGLNSILTGHFVNWAGVKI